MAAPNGENPSYPGDRIFAALAPYTSFDDGLRLRLVSSEFRFYLKRLGRPPPPFPWLMLPERSSASPTPLLDARRSFYDVPAGRAYRYYVPGEAFHRCVASAHGWLVLKPVDKPGLLMMVNPITLLKVDVPWPYGEHLVDRFHAALTSSPHDPECLLVVASDRLVAYCRPGRVPGGFAGWRTLHALGFRYDAAASDIVAVGAMVYLIDAKRKLWRVDLAAPEPKVVRRDMVLPLPDGERRRHYLVALLGAVHLVISDEHFKRVALFRMDWESRMWVPADCLRSGCVLLLGRGCSAAVPAGRGRVPGSALFAHQPSISIDAGEVGAGAAGGEDAWFWAESRLSTGPDDLLVLKKTMMHRPGEFNASDSFWFFPAIDPDERLQLTEKTKVLNPHTTTITT